MDVDLLRPGTVPISKDTVMWFEFLLDPLILETHLKKQKPDPSPADLISKFLTISADISSGKDIVVLEPDSEEEKLNPSRRSRGLKILALKIAAFLNWDLEILEQKIPFPTQWMLFQDLLNLVHEEIGSTDLTKEPDHVLFILSLYHRWSLRALLNNALNSKMRNMMALEMQDDRFYRLEQEAEQSVIILSEIIKIGLATSVLIPSAATFVPLVEEGKNEKTPNWTVGVNISSAQFFTLILMDLGTYLFYREEYTIALPYFEKCKQEFQKWKSCTGTSETEYCHTDIETINGYITACQAPVISQTLSLTDRFLVSINNHYEGILAILSEDNVKRDVPVRLRDSLEQDITAAISSGGFTATRDLIFQIQSLNIVYKRAVDLPCLYNYVDKLAAARRGVDIFIWALKATLTEIIPEEKERLALFVLEIIEQSDLSIQSELLCHDIIRQLTTDFQLPGTDMKTPDTQVFVPPDFNNIQLKNGELENQLIASYDPHHIKEIIIKLLDNNAYRPVWQIENKWELGIPLHGIVLNLQSGLLQHYLYVLLGKAKYLDSLGRYDVARRLLLAAEADINHHGGMMKLAQLIVWEIFLVESHQLHAEWPNKTTGCNTLVSRCLNILQMSEAMVLPRVEIVEQATVTLLNLGEWEALVSVAPDKRFILCDLSASLAQACQDIAKFKGNKKISRGAWDLIVPVFGPSGGIGKRGLSHEPPMLQAIVRFFSLLRDWTVISAAISLLARLHNVVRDEVSLELICDYTALWPGVVSNTSSYNIQLVGEHLLQLVNSALEYYPKNLSLHKLLGDYYFVGGQHSAAMKHYLLSAVIATESFSRPLTKALVEDYVYKRMIKCLGQLNCHTQAGVLCQFLEEVDYNTAFKSLAESVCHDCMDTYYDCIWDVNILEYLIYLQNKRGNKDRAKKAIDMIGLLELNANNNEEIKREAANKRKIRFMEALVRQYVL